MKTIPNTNFTIVIVKDGPNATSVTLLALTLNQPPQGGYDLATMRARNKILDKLEKIKEGQEIILEDAEYAMARKCVEDYRWGAQHPDIIKFAEQFGL